jgi:hypothetical protein
MKSATRELLKKYLLSFSVQLSDVVALNKALKKERITTEELIEEIGAIMRENRTIVPVYNEKDYERSVSC